MLFSKRKNWLFCPLFFLSTLIFAQEFREIADIKSPNIASLGEYGKIPVSLSRGSVDINVPLYTLIDGNIIVPISLRYKSTGVKVNQIPSDVGLNWSLHAGGMISRVMKGLPDETKYKSVTDSELSVRTELNIASGYFYNSHLLSDVISNENELRGFLEANYDKDFEPDEFIFNFNGYSGRFFFSQTGEWVIDGLVGTEITYELDKRTNRSIVDIVCENPVGSYCVAVINTVEFDIIKSFKLKTPDGMEYTFGSAETSFNYSKNSSPEDNVAWMLTEIYNPKNKQSVFFEYHNKTYIRSALEMSYFKQTTTSHADWLSSFLFGKPSTTNSIKRYRVNNIAGVAKQLKKIRSKNYEIDFEHVESKQLNYDFDLIEASFELEIEDRNRSEIWANQLSQFYTPEQGFSFSGSASQQSTEFGLNYRPSIDPVLHQLNTIVVKSRLTNRLVRGFYFEYTSDESKRLYLKKIKENNENPYVFEYNHEGELPNYLDQNWLTDHWGYFNNKPNPIPHDLFPFDSSVLESYYESRAPDENYSDYGSLRKITYPTMGYTEFKYENNRYSKSVNKNNFTNNGYSLTSYSSELLGGGIRIKSISNYDVSNTLIGKKMYSYENGILPYTPIYFIPNNSYYSFDGNSISGSMFRTTSIVELEEKGNTPIQYSKIIEEKVDHNNVSIGKTEYTYSNYDSFPDYGYDSTISPNLKMVSPAMKTHSSRGNLLSKKVFSNEVLLHEEIFGFGENSVYEKINAIQVNYFSSYGINTPGRFAQASFYRIPVNSYKAFTVTKNEYHNSSNVTSTEIREYNNIDLLERSLLQNSNNQTMESHFTYVNHLLESSSNNSFLLDLGKSTPIQSSTRIGGKIVDANLSTYFLNENDHIVSDQHLSYENSTVNDELFSPTYYNNSFQSDSNLKEKIAFKEQDKYGNLTHYQTNGNKNIFQLWGYNGEHIVAKITGDFSYNDLVNALGQINSAINSLDYDFGYSEQELISTFNQLRVNFPNAHIVSYTYKHGFGISTITDTKGKIKRYSYDGKKLISISDQNHNILEQFDYNYIGYDANTVDDIKLGSITNNSSETPTVNENFIDLSVNVIQPGSGNLTFTWTIDLQNGESLVYKTKEPTLQKSVPYEFYPSINLTCSVIDNYSFSEDSKSIFLNISMIPAYLSEVNNFRNYSIKGGSGHFSYHWDIDTINTNYYGGVVSTKNRQFTTESGIIELANYETDSCSETTINLDVEDLKLGSINGFSRSFTTYCEQSEDPIPDDCFVAGTKITMYDGTKKKIEDIIVGDKVATYNLKSKQIESGEVLEFVNLRKNQFVKIMLANGATNISTTDHPYYIIKKGWSSYQPNLTLTHYKTKTSKLRVGDMVLLSNPETTSSEIVSIEVFESPLPVYNLKRVSVNENYFANDMLVHNKSKF